ncbi:hypothetical protein SNEBB_000063 [Seison nebaliae]|nr:hypothetical protein SNEBB_000063 [Seison nebaliae]
MVELKTVNKHIVKTIDRYINKNKTGHEKIKPLFDEKFRTLDTYLSEENNKFFHLPTNQFHILYHLTRNYEKLISLMGETLLYELKKMPLPTKDDLYGAGIGLLRLQKVYNISSEDMAKGNLSDTIKAFTPLSAEECEEMCKIALEERSYGFCVAWAVEGLKALELTSVPEKEISLNLNVDENFDINYLLPMSLLVEELKKLEPRSKKQMFYEETCFGGEDWQKRINSLDGKELYCDLFTNNNHPMLILGPVKREVLFVKPFIVRFYEVITQKEMDLIGHYGKRIMDRATVQEIIGKNEVSKARIQKSAFLTTYQYPFVTKLYKNIAIITGLEIQGDLQFGNYGIGGEYKPHYDCFDVNKLASTGQSSNQRIATWMYYLSDVEKGGATVFPNVGARVVPIKRSAVFWYNLHKNGKPDVNTLHAACPILIGIKSVANHWITVGDQMFNRPCDLDSNL